MYDDAVINHKKLNKINNLNITASINDNCITEKHIQNIKIIILK